MLAPSRVSTGQEGSTRRICNAHAWTTQASAPAQPSRKSGGDVRVAARLVGLPPARPPPTCTRHSFSDHYCYRQRRPCCSPQGKTASQAGQSRPLSAANARCRLSLHTTHDAPHTTHHSTRRRRHAHPARAP
jgi:hypothetical protein